MNAQNYQLWLKDEQKELILNYILERRYSFMITMYFSLGVSIVILLYFLSTSLVYVIIPEAVVYFLFAFVSFIVMFFRGIGKTFGKNSDYDCLKNDNYQLDFCEFGGKYPDTGHHPYFIRDNCGNTYKCPLFLDWRNAQEGDTLICVSLNNGQKYALLQKISLDKY